MSRVCDYFTLASSPKIVWHRVHKNHHADPRPVKLAAVGFNNSASMAFTLRDWAAMLDDGRAVEYTPFEEVIP